ncbi:Galactose-3-O-sulfotransferase 3 [Mizuhopecten yessoensis]|uniref:Galactose-3-O-sulfotransferase 3 n=2 Tax=Mizuhopecten yessoensis TaxID=6573 RepID=A0A210PGU0_MIZYE|nr:Galactose-3-O-sulfotransferase 3 [Mizuhopecten yessoensis]
MQNLFLRFGIEHDLVFVLPQHGTTLPMGTGLPISSRALPPPRNRTYDILCNHIRYNRSEFEKTLPSDSVYVATVRDPFRQFISSVHYYHRHFMLNIAKQQPILKFLQAPNEYRRIIGENKKVSNLYNSMAWDFGFPFQLFVKPDEKQIQKYLRKLDKEFDLVIVVEYFEESLILMRRLLNWDMRHILYVSSHVQKRPEPSLAVGKEEEDLYRKWCLLDYALFDFFKRKFLKRWQEAVSKSDVMAELQYFREMKTKVNKYCQKQLKPSPLHIKPSEWHAGFIVDSQYCKIRRYGEVKQINNLRNKQLQTARHGN